MKRFIFVALCVCSVHSFKIFPLVTEPISVQAGIAEDDAVVFTNLPAAINALRESDERSPNSSISEPTTDVPSVLETTTVSLNPINVDRDSRSSTDSALNAETLQDSTTLSDIVTDSTSPSEGAVDASNSATKSLGETASSFSTSASDSTTSLPDSVNSTSLSESTTSSEAKLSQSTTINDALEVSTEDLSFLSLDLLPPKTEYRKNEPDPRYDY